MRHHLIALALVAASGATTIATAAPDATSPANPSRRKPADAGDDVQITIRAGRGRLGFAALQISPALRKHLGAPEDRGVLVDQLRADSPAARAGVEVGDVITDVDGKPCRSAVDVLAALDTRKRGDTVAIGVWRGTARTELHATLVDDLDPMPAFDGELWRSFGDDPFDLFEGDLQRSLERMRQRLEQLRPRSDRTDRTRT